MSDDRRHGMSPELVRAIERSETGRPDEPEQARLALDDSDQDDYDPHLSPLRVGPSGGLVPMPARRRGRPRGARNRITKDAIDFYLRQHRDPMAALFETVSMGPRGVALAYFVPDGGKLTRADLHHGAEMWRKMHGELMSYIHSRQPTAVKIEDVQFMPIDLGNFGKTPAELVAQALAGVSTMDISAEVKATITAQMLVGDDAQAMPAGELRALEEIPMKTVDAGEDEEEVSQSPVLQSEEKSNETDT